MSHPRFTLITAALNPGPEVVQTIESVLGQAGPGLQYIFVDGASRPECFAHVEPYTRHFSQLIREPDRGISDAWNKALALAEGDIVGIINADDHLLPGALTHVSQAFEDPQALRVVHGNAVRIEGGREFLRRPQRPLALMMRLGMPLLHPATFVSRSVYQAVGGFNVERRIAMDYDLLLRAYLAGAQFVHLPQALAAFRSGGLSDQRPLEGFRDVRESQLSNGLSRPLVELMHAAKVGVRRYVRPLLGRC